MPDFSDYPDDLSPILSDFSAAVDALMRDLQEGKITLAEWRERFAQLLAAYISTAYLTGGEKDDIVGDAAAWITGWLALQLDFLNGFRDAIAANYATGGAYSPAWDARAQMYVAGATAPYWYGETDGLPIPAYPADGTSQCMSSCNCALDIQWVDQESVSVDVYWRLNQKRVSEHNCQTCRERAVQWNPLKIRDGKLIIPPVAESRGALVGR